MPADASRADVTRRCRLELVLLAILTPIYIAFGPRGMLVHMTLALGFLAYILVDARYTREMVWQRTDVPPSLRRRRSLLLIAPFTLLVAGALIAWGLHQGATVDALDTALRLTIYLAWACVQQTLFQFYLQGRLLCAAPGLPLALIVIVNGLAYGLVHLPDVQLMVLTCLAGVIWSADYYRNRLLAPVALSHALLGTTYYAMVT